MDLQKQVEQAARMADKHFAKVAEGAGP